MTCGTWHGSGSFFDRLASVQAAFLQRFPSKTTARFSKRFSHSFHKLLELELVSDYAKMREVHLPPTLELHHRNIESHSKSEDLWAGRLRVKGIGSLYRGVQLAWVTAVCKTHDRNELPGMLATALEERGLEWVDEPQMRRVKGRKALPELLGPLEDALKRVSNTQPVVLVNFESLMLGNEPKDRT